MRATQLLITETNQATKVHIVHRTALAPPTLQQSFCDSIHQINLKNQEKVTNYLIVRRLKF